MDGIKKKLTKRQAENDLSATISDTENSLIDQTEEVAVDVHEEKAPALEADTRSTENERIAYKLAFEVEHWKNVDGKQEFEGFSIDFDRAEDFILTYPNSIYSKSAVDRLRSTNVYSRQSQSSFSLAFSGLAMTFLGCPLLGLLVGIMVQLPVYWIGSFFFEMSDDLHPTPLIICALLAFGLGVYMYWDYEQKKRKLLEMLLSRH